MLSGCEYQILMWGVSNRGGYQAQIWDKQELPHLHHRCSNDNDSNIFATEITKKMY